MYLILRINRSLYWLTIDSDLRGAAFLLTVDDLTDLSLSPVKVCGGHHDLVAWGEQDGNTSVSESVSDRAQHTRTRTYIHTRAHACTRTHTHTIHASTHINTHTHTHRGSSL